MELHNPFKRDLITVKEAAELADRTPQTIRNWLAENKIRKYKRKRGPQIYVSRQEIVDMLEIEEMVGI